MEVPVARQSHPFVTVAAIAVTVFCLVGIGAVMGWIPTSIGGGGCAPAARAPEQPITQVDTAGPLAQAPAQPRAQAEVRKPAPGPVARQTQPRPNPVAWAEPPQQVAQDAARQAMSHGMREVEIRVKGPGSGRESAIRALQAIGLEISVIKDVTPVPHNGCRPRKKRRV